MVYDDPDLALRIRLSRLMVLETAAIGVWLAVAERRRFGQAIRSLIYQRGNALNLAIFRIVVFRQIYNACYFDFIARIAALPSGLQYPPQTGIPPRGTFARFAVWPSHDVPPAVIKWAGAALKCAAVMGMLGFCSRGAAAVTAFLFVFAWGRLQWYGKVDHHHHLVWFAVLLALSRSGDALSVDRLIANWRGTYRPAPASRYGTPIGFSMLLMGVIYLFPGLWKICRSGLDWACSDSPKMMLHREWRAYGDWMPALRFDRFPVLYQGGALAALLFELSFLWLLLGRRTRIIAGALGAGFHLATQTTMNIEFETLRNCYVLFVDWRGLLKRITGSTEDEAPIDVDRGSSSAIAIAGVLLLAGNAWAGAMRMIDGWPLACYPPFDGLSEPHSRTLRIAVTLRNGSERQLIPDDYRDVFGNRWNNLLQRILQNRCEEEKKMKLGLVWQVLGRTEAWVKEAAKVKFYSVRSFVHPDRWGEEPDDPQLLFETEFQA